MRYKGKRVNGASLTSFSGQHIMDDQAELSPAARRRIGKRLAAFGLASVMTLSLAFGSIVRPAVAADVGVIAFTADESQDLTEDVEGVILDNQGGEENGAGAPTDVPSEELGQDGEGNGETDIPDEGEVPKGETAPSDEKESQSPDPSNGEGGKETNSPENENGEAETPESESPPPAPADSEAGDDEIVIGDGEIADNAALDNGIQAASTAYTLTIPHAMIGDCSGSSDVLTFELSGSGITTTTTTVTGNKEIRFTVELPTAGTYNLSARCISGDTDFYYADTRTCKVTLTVAANGSVTEGTPSFENADGPVGVSSFITTYPMQSSVWSDATVAKAQKIMADMTDDEKIGQCFLVHYPGDGSGSIAQAKARINKYHPGGYLVFAAMFNNSNPTTVQGKTSAAQADSIADSGLPMIFSVDEEGGKVVRISDKAAFGHAKFDFPQNIAANGEAAVEADAADKAQFLKNLGMTVNHAPVGDVSGPSGYIYPRTYGGDGLYNSKFVAAAVRGHEQNGIATTVKHFPGYGGTGSNTHNGFAINDLSLDELRYNDLIPFYQAMGAGGKSFMVTHNIFNCLDPEMPASLSPAVISYARDVMRFDGVIMTDDLNMAAVIKSVGECHGALASLKAGVDMPMTPLLNTSTNAEGNDIPLVKEAIASGELSMDRIEESCLRVLCWKIDMGLIDDGEVDPTPTPPIPEEQEAEWTSLDGNTTEQGTFDSMWAKAIANGGTVKMLVDVDTAGDKSVPAKNITLNLNGHKLHFTDGTNGFIVNGSTSTSFTITDNVDPTITTEENPANREEAAYNAVRRTLVYYTMSETGVVTKHEVDMDTCGGISGANTGIMVEVKSGVFNLEGGVLSHKVRAVETINNASNVINIKGGAIVGCGVAQGGTTVNGSGVGVYGGGTLNISGGYIGGNEATTRGGGIILDSGKINMSGGVVAANKISTNGGAIYVNTGGTVNVTGGTFASNFAGAQGGAIYLFGNNSSVNVSGDAKFTMNSTNGHGGAIFSIAGWGSTGNCTIAVENGLFTGNTAENGGAIRSGSSASNGGTVNITGGTFRYNTAKSSGGAVHLYGATKGATLKNAEFSRNEAKDGGAIYMDSNVTATIDSISVEDNQATGNGGGINIAAGQSGVNVTNMTVRGNATGGIGGGVYMGGTQMTLTGDVIIDRNRVGTQGNNLYLPAGKTVKLTNTLGPNSVIGVTTATDPTTTAPVPVATASQTAMLTNSLSRFYSDKAGYSPSLQSSQIMLVVGDSGEQGPPIEFDGILFQYYADVTSLAVTGDADRRLEIIDTTGKKMPANGQSITTNPGITPRYIYLNEDGSVKTTTDLMAIYKSRDIMKSQLTSLGELNKFGEEGDYYTVNEIWVLREGGYPGSTKMSDWIVYPWSNDLNFTTDPTKVNDKTFLVDTGSVVRYVCSAVTGEYSGSVAMYDYDITDGKLYASEADAKDQINPMAVSTQEEWEATHYSTYMHTYHSGINSDDNYTGTGKHFAFGNANTRTGYGTETRDGYNFNSANRGKAAPNNVHFHLCHFGIVKGLDENGHIIYDSEISVPNLFDEGPAIGKTVYSDYKLNFIRRGDQYILSSIGGLEDYASGLENFGHPGIYDGIQNKTVIWSNNFWPMDGVPSYGTDDHDPKFGRTGGPTRQSPVLPNASSGGKAMPYSDDALDHNAYFGMQYTMEFTLTPDYVGPLEYTFFGDDDLWVFLDGQLVCDIGGVHQSTGAFVNLRDYLSEEDSGDHQLKVYYLERGASGSTCWMRFNLPHMRVTTDEEVEFPGSLKIEKFAEGKETDQEFEFTVSLTLNDEDGVELADEFTYTGSKNGTLKSGGTINLAPGESVIIQNLPIGTNYTVTETAADGWDITSTGETGVIGNGRSTAHFVNKYHPQVGTLRISKTVIWNTIENPGEDVGDAEVVEGELSVAVALTNTPPSGYFAAGDMAEYEVELTADSPCDFINICVESELQDFLFDATGTNTANVERVSAGETVLLAGSKVITLEEIEAGENLYNGINVSAERDDESGIGESVYTESQPIRPEPIYTLTVRYVYVESGGTVSAPVTMRLPEGASYRVPSPAITGYTADCDIIQGSMPGKDISVTITYKPKTVNPDPGPDIPDVPTP